MHSLHGAFGSWHSMNWAMNWIDSVVLAVYLICFTLMLLGLVFAPFYVKSRVHTLPEFMERRYCPQARTFLAVIGVLGALLIHIGISLFAAAKVFETLLGVPMFAT